MINVYQHIDRYVPVWTPGLDQHHGSARDCSPCYKLNLDYKTINKM